MTVGFKQGKPNDKKIMIGNLISRQCFTNSGWWGDISLIVRRQTRTRERENGQIVRRNAAWGELAEGVRGLCGSSKM